MAVLGLGMGFLMQTTMLIAQNSVEQKDLGVASSAATFFRSIGGSFGVALFGTIFVRHLKRRHRQPARRRPRPTDHQRRRPGRPARRAASCRRRSSDALLHGIASALSTVFLWAIPFAAVVAVLAFFIKEIPLRGGPTTAGTAARSTGPGRRARLIGPLPERTRATHCGRGLARRKVGSP